MPHATRQRRKPTDDWQQLRLLATVTEARLFETPYRSPQLPLWERQANEWLTVIVGMLCGRGDEKLKLSPVVGGLSTRTWHRSSWTTRTWSAAGNHRVDARLSRIPISLSSVSRTAIDPARRWQPLREEVWYVEGEVPGPVPI